MINRVKAERMLSSYLVRHPGAIWVPNLRMRTSELARMRMLSRWSVLSDDAARYFQSRMLDAPASRPVASPSPIEAGRAESAADASGRFVLSHYLEWTAPIRLHKVYGGLA